MIELSQADWDALYQPHKNLLIRIDLYEYTPDANDIFAFHKVDEIQGVAISGTVVEDANSEVRRTGDLTIHVLNSSFVISNNSRVWLDKYLSIYVGYEAQKTKEMLWYHLGIMELMDLNYSYNPSTQELQIRLSDMTVSLDGTKSGTVMGANPQFPVDEISIRRAIEDTLAQLGNWHLYMVDNLGEFGYEDVTTKNRIPYTMEWTRPISVYEIVTDLRDLYPGYESYFEKDGTFRVKRIPTCMNDPVMMTHEQLAPLVIGETNNGVDFSEVKNITEVIGHSYDDGGYYTHIVTGSGGDYFGIFESFKYEAFEDEEIFSFTPNHTNPGSCMLKVNDLEPLPILMNIPNMGDKEIPEGFIEEGIPIVVKYVPDENHNRRFLYLGRTQVRGLYMLVSKPRDWLQQRYDILKYNTQNIKYGVNPDSPITVDKIGEKAQVLSGGDYDTIFTEVAAIERAQYETWLKTNMAYSLTLETILIPWLEVNQKIAYQSPLEELQRKELGLEIDHDEDHQYIIKRISRDLESGTQTMELTRFYNLYPWILSATNINI